MSATIATFSRSPSDHTVLRIAANWLKGLFAPEAHQGAAETKALNAIEELSFWQLYRLTVGYDSISPKVAAEVRSKLVG